MSSTALLQNSQNPVIEEYLELERTKISCFCTRQKRKNTLRYCSCLFFICVCNEILQRGQGVNSVRKQDLLGKSITVIAEKGTSIREQRAAEGFILPGELTLRMGLFQIQPSPTLQHRSHSKAADSNTENIYLKQLPSPPQGYWSTKKESAVSRPGLSENPPAEAPVSQLGMAFHALQYLQKT